MGVSFTMILLNTIVLAVDYYNQPRSIQRLLLNLNMLFTCIFAGEMIFKIVAFGLLGYLRDSFNVFDGVLVVISLAGMAVE